MRRFPIAVAVLGLFSLAGCGLRAERTNLRHCTFAPVSWKPLSSVGDTLRFAVGMEIGNPTGQAAALDSFRLLASARSPLGILTHGRTQRVEPGRKDTAEILLSITKASIASTALQMVFSPPDSLTIEGDAWTPGLVWGWNQHVVRTRFDLAPHMDQLRALLGKAIKP